MSILNGTFDKNMLHAQFQYKVKIMGVTFLAIKAP